MYWIFVRLFYRCTGGFSRLREVMADFDAIAYSGGETFASALSKVIVNSEALERWGKGRELAKGEIPRVADEVAALMSSLSPQDASGLRDTALDRVAGKWSAYETHPSPKVRLRYARGAGCTGEATCSAQPARVLFDDWSAMDQSVSRAWLTAAKAAAA